MTNADIIPMQGSVYSERRQGLSTSETTTLITAFSGTPAPATTKGPLAGVCNCGLCQRLSVQYTQLPPEDESADVWPEVMAEDISHDWYKNAYDLSPQPAAHLFSQLEAFEHVAKEAIAV